MKSISLIILAVSFSISAFCQNDSSKNMPPLEMLPKEGQVKNIYELPLQTEYKVYNSNGEILTNGKGQFIDYTAYKKGAYFVVFEGGKESFEKK